MMRIVLTLAVRGAAVFAVGALLAVLTHYGLHRMLLTIEPFIYVSF